MAIPTRSGCRTGPANLKLILTHTLVATISIVLIAGCGGRTAVQRGSDRLKTLEQAFAVRGGDPEKAIDYFAAAGPGSTLETARLEAWYDAMQRCGADSPRWRAFLAARPPERLASKATLALATALEHEGDLSGAVAILVNAPEDVRHIADLELLDLADEKTAADAAGRLARVAPLLLRRHSRSLQRSVLATFDHDDWMGRAAAWRSVGLGSQGASELRGQRRRGDEEMERRVELARCELDAGSSSRALNALPPRSESDPIELTLRAEAYRRRGWGRVPDRGAITAFATCLDEARLAVPRADAATRTHALALVLECGTEAGDLGGALAAWRELEATAWHDRRRSWLGRRLGVALARSGFATDALAGLESALPNHQRCLRYWRSVTAADGEALADLAETEIIDLYGRWARGRIGRVGDSDHWSRPAPVGASEPAFAVAWLMTNAGLGEASSEWQRLFEDRRPTRSEALTAADLAAAAGRPNTAIRTLRSAFPGIATIAIADTPTDAAIAYLPLRWSDEIVASARETGLDPWLIAAVARQESTFVADALSPAGARGVMQLLPSTARIHARRLGLGTLPDLADPAINIRLGAQELAALVGRFGALEPALGAYNAGERRVRSWWRRWPDADVFAESVPIPETYDYIRRVVFLSDAYRRIHNERWSSTP